MGVEVWIDIQSQIGKCKTPVQLSIPDGGIFQKVNPVPQLRFGKQGPNSFPEHRIVVDKHQVRIWTATEDFKDCIKEARRQPVGPRNVHNEFSLRRQT